MSNLYPYGRKGWSTFSKIRFHWHQFGRVCRSRSLNTEVKFQRKNFRWNRSRFSTPTYFLSTDKKFQNSKFYRYILQPYDLNHRLDNSILQVTLNITLKEGDTIFQRPLTRMQPILLPGEEEKRRNNSLPNPRINNTLSIPTAGKIVFWHKDFRHNKTNDIDSPVDLVVGNEVTAEDPSHTRNSSTTSQASAGYSSQNSQPAHSRHSSSGGESNHGRWV